MDVIYIRDLRIDTVIGVPERERRHPQPLEFDIEIGLAEIRACRTDQLADTVDYAAVVAAIQEILAQHRFRLLEPLGQQIADMIMARFGAIWVRIEITKAGIVPSARCVGVRIERGRPA
ncbi:MAG: dihydroneopterin aldolase [Betaproteobacteria bacterium]|nr:dihydroneopterin aldolase [Betaproteobacteria bacterium]